MKFFAILFAILGGIQMFANENLKNLDQGSYDMSKEYLAIIEALNNIKGAECLEKFQQTNDSVAVFMRQPDTSQELTQKKIRSLKLNLQLVLLNTLDNNLDLAFNPEDVPELNIQPPRGTSVSSGASPDAIKDPKSRKEYEEAIRKNTIKANNYNFQTWIRRTKPNLLRELIEYINQNYSRSIQDREEIDRVIDSLISNSKTRITIKEMISKGK